MNTSTNPIADPSIDALQRYEPYLSAEAYHALLTTIHEPAPFALRVNLLKSPDPAQALAKWTNWYGWETSPVPSCPAGFQLKVYNTPPSQTIEHRLGYFYLQDAASMLPAALLPLRNSRRTRWLRTFGTSKRWRCSGMWREKPRAKRGEAPS